MTGMHQRPATYSTQDSGNLVAGERYRVSSPDLTLTIFAPIFCLKPGILSRGRLMLLGDRGRGQMLAACFHVRAIGKLDDPTCRQGRKTDQDEHWQGALIGLLQRTPDERPQNGAHPPHTQLHSPRPCTHARLLPT